MCRELYCKRCVLKSTNAGVTIDEKGLCNQCNGDNTKEFFGNYRKSSKEYRKFKQEVQEGKESRNYDCMVMFSGGKDSINILHKMSVEEGLRVLAVTIDIPYESKKAEEQMELVTNKLDIDYIKIRPTKKKYIKLMKAVFENEYQGEKMNLDHLPKFKHLSPCIICTCYMTLLACLLAKRLNIPYVMYCADPGQIANLPNGLKNVVETFRSLFDDEFINDILTDDIALLDEDQTENVPQIVYPYIDMPTYSPKEIIAKLQELGLYTGSPVVSHCRLWSMINYYSIIRNDSPYYILDYATVIRNNNTPTRESDREQLIEAMEAFKPVLKKLAKGEITEEEDNDLRQFLRIITKTDDEFEYFYNNCYQLKEMIHELGVEL